MVTDIKEQAIKLRKQGMTYQQISDELYGEVSVDWCKKNLKGVAKEKLADECVQELVEKSTRPEGISVYEANAIIFKHNKATTLTKDDLKNIRKKAVYADKNCMFRPAWIDVTKPTESYKSMMAYATHLSDEIDNLVRYYCDSYPSVNPKAVRYELIKHVYPKITPEPLSGHIMRAETMAEQLASRTIKDVVIGDEVEEDTEDKIDTKIDLFVKDSDLDNYVHVTEEELDSIWKA